MDISLFVNLLKNLLSTDVLMVSDLSGDLEGFEKKYCFNSVLQPMYKADAMHYLISSSNKDVLYEINDSLGVCVSFFTINDSTFVIGPFVKEEFSDSKTETLLVENKIPASNSIALKLYYTALPLLYTDYIQKVVNALVISFYPGHIEPGYRRLSGFISESTESASTEIISATNYSEIYRRYDSEKRFLNMIRNGDVANVELAFKAMATDGIPSTMAKEAVSHYNPATSFAILRSLSRKAAEESGLSVVTIDAITQKYVQLVSKANRVSDQTKLLINMVKELTAAVRDYKLSYGSYSPAVQKVLEYINLHIGQEISLDTLSDIASVSVSHLSKLFKAETGDTITGYIARIRTQKAAQLLKETALPISEISSFVGYEDNNYFVKVFKKIYQITPTEYRKKSL
jgi:AraC-like DNA-binding protein